MTVDEFVNVLVAEMEADGSTDLVDEMQKAARAKMAAGNGSIGTLTQSGVNGKNFTRQVDMTPIQIVNACRQALKQYLDDGDNDDRVSASYADFSCIAR
jgi:hypothetical protein